MIRFFGRHENYGYLNALLRSRLSYFLGKEEYETLLRRDVEGMESYLLESKYGGMYRNELVSREHNVLQRIEVALAMGMGNELLRMRKSAEGETRDLVTILLARGDLHNVRVLLRSFLPGSDRTYGEPLWHIYGIVPPEEMRLLWKSKNLQELVERSHDIRNPLGNALGNAAMNLLRGLEYWKVERGYLLDYRNYLFGVLASCLSSNGKLVETYLRMMVDMLNLGIWLRKEHGFHETDDSYEADYLGGGTISESALAQSRSLQEAVRGTLWTAMIRQIDEATPNLFQQALSRSFLRWQASFLRRNPLGIEVAMGYVARQVAEWDNLNYIVTGLALRYPKDKIRQRLLIF
ncbi:MAG TPA: V-type ATPase subunit [Synergistaceae bacterium]|nr:V-type ATPase subunit [Synergistaceae bacterium]HPJ25219.1 V-type ATPase subunit [Synergistaceae bacterium]HPQ36090.1 V-type ATPase subunit [Synergistaceae bacterium]